MHTFSLFLRSVIASAVATALAGPAFGQETLVEPVPLAPSAGVPAGPADVPADVVPAPAGPVTEEAEPTEEEMRWALCPPPPERPLIPDLPRRVTEIRAESATSEGPEGQEISVLFGDVVIVRDGARISAAEARYDQAADVATVEGDVEYHGGPGSFQAQRGIVNLGTKEGEFEEAFYYLPGAHAFGQTNRAQIHGEDRAELSDATYTTCPPQAPDWLLRADEMHLDRSTNTGEAYDVTLQVGPVPVVYLPYINFPLEGRKTGLLVPTFDTSERNGTDFQLPWYWNIAPNQDATITPRVITARGPMLQTEYRYLTEDSRGVWHADYLKDDKMFGSDRRLVTVFHQQRLAERWNALVDYKSVSDTLYFGDIDSTLATSSTTHLERRADLSYAGDGWTLLSRVQDFQPLVPGREPYMRRPQLLASGGWSGDFLRYDISAEYAYFGHDTETPIGSRIDVYPGISAPLEGDAWFVKPRLAAHHTQYDLEEVPVDSSGTPIFLKNASRTVPVASLDSGLFFERETTLFDVPLLHTLEPRLYYLNVPFKDQSEIPVFDTKLPTTLSFASLFSENRFIGADRIGDANQVTTAVTTRVYSEESGVELARASVGQIHYFEDRQVTLSGNEVDTRGYSDLAAELAAQPIRGMEISATSRWDPDVSDARESALRARYIPNKRHIIDAAYRYRTTPTTREMSRDIFLLWPLTPRWHAVGRWYFDLETERTLESVVGVEYETCCWLVRAVGRDRPFTDPETGSIESDRSISFTVELKGLANIGQGLEGVIERGIVGYQ